jgi:hypothetical protein
MRIVTVKSRDPVEMIREIGKQLGGAGDLSMPDTGRFHALFDAQTVQA